MFESALSLITESDDIGVICFNPDIDKNGWKTRGTYGNYFTELKKLSVARINAVAALWKKDFLIKVLKRGESPWEFETNGTERGKHCNETVLCLSDAKNAPFNFHFCIGYGYGITARSWLPKTRICLMNTELK